MDSLVGKYYFNVKSTAAWKVVHQYDGRIECKLVRIAAKWATRYKDFYLGATQIYRISDLEKSRVADNWTFVDNLNAAITLYSTGQEEMLYADD